MDSSDSSSTLQSPDETRDDAAEFRFQDNSHNQFVLEKLNTLRKNRQFCDLVLQVGSGQELHELYAHKAVLAAASGYFLEALTSCDLNGSGGNTNHSSPVSSIASSNGGGSNANQQINGLKTSSNGLSTSTGCCAPVYLLPCNVNELPCMLALLEYAYTGRLNVPRNQVRTLYMLANRMRMLPVAQHCARHLLSNLTVQNCLPLRSTSGLRHDPPLLCAVDAFVRDHASQVLNSPAAQRLPRVHLDLLHSGLRPAQCVNRCRLFDLALHWMRQQLQQRRLKVDSLTSRSFMLYLDQLDHRLHDCMQLSSLDVQYSEAVHEYQCLGRGQCHEEGCAGEVEHHALEPNVNIFSNAVDEDRQRSVKSKEISRSVDGIGRSQDLHSLLDTEEDRAHLPCLIELEDQWAMQQGKQSATGSGSQLKMKLQQLSGRDTVVDADETSEHDSNSRASNGNKPCLLTRSDSSSSLSSLPDEDEGDWKLLATDCLTKHTLVALAMAAGRLCMIHIRLRVAQSNMSPGTIDEATTSPSNGKAALSKVEGQAWSESTEFVTVKDIVGKPQYITLAPLPRGRSALGVVAIEGRLLVCGGYDRSECLRSVDLYDPNTNSWTACASMQEPRGRFALTVVDERVFAIGGSNGQKDLNSVEQFVNNQWSFVGNCPSVRSYAGVCELNGKVYVIGGWRALQRCDVYDPASDCWTRIADLNVGRSQVAVAVLNGVIYAVGGTNEWACLNSVEKLDDENGSWKSIGSLHVGRRGAALADFQGRLIAIGGHDGRNSLTSTEVYDDRSDSWVKGPALGVGRANVAAAVVDGKLFAVGGFSGKHFLHSMEYLEQIDGQWSGFVRDNRTPQNDSPAEYNE